MDITDPQPQTALTVRTSDTAKTQMEILVKLGFEEFKQSLAKETDIRILVGQAGGSGHQSSAITILKLITLLWRSVSVGHVNEKTVHLIYQSERNYTQLTNTEKELEKKPCFINGIPVVLEQDLPGMLSSKYRYGFACGYDDPDNLAKKCNVQYFLRLQPVFWRQMDEIHFNDWGWGEEDVNVLLINYDYTTVASRGLPLPKLKPLCHYPDFRCLGYFHESPGVPVWKAQDPTETAIQTILKGVDLDRFELCITYSIEARTVFSNTASEIIFNLATGFVCAKNRKWIQKNHVVILNFSVQDDTHKELMEKARLMLLPPAQRHLELEKMGPGTFTDSIVAAEKSVLPCGIYGEIEGARLQFHYLDIGDPMDTILGDNDSFHVILINIPTRQQKSVFEFCLTKVTLFSVFEGSGTASVTGIIGKPYLKYNPLFPKETHYLNFPNGDPVLTKDTADLCQVAGNSVAFAFSHWRVPENEVWTLPSLTLARFIALYKTEDQPLKKYFEEARAFYTKPTNTRFFISLGIFNMLIKNKEARKNVIDIL